VRLPTLLIALSVVCAAVGPDFTRAAMAGQKPRSSARPPAGLDAKRLALIEPLVNEAIARHELPGAVVLAGRGNQILYKRAFGNRAVKPAVEPMTVDTIFDLASLTKVVATTTAVMLLVEDGQLRLSDRVSDHVPGFERYGKDRITIRHLLTHTSGLRPDLDLEEPFESAAEGIRRAVEEVPVAQPNERIIYSDINFFLLGHIVEQVAHRTLDAFLKDRVFGPLDMRDTGFLPAASLRNRIAPTESCEPLAWPCETPAASMLRGIVHDPTARRMGGYAGHAGLFGTADDLAVFARMLLAGGTLNGHRILSPLSVAKMTRRATPESLVALRGLGWDIDSPLSGNRGELFPVGSFGHTGFTGTSMWMDPLTKTFVIFLSNRVHPDGKGDVTPLRAKVASIVASAIPDAIVPPAAAMTGADFGLSWPPRPAMAVTRVLTGIDVLRAEGFARLRGRRVGLVTNHTGRAADGTPTIDLLAAQKDLTVVALFSPEHGIRGVVDESVPSTKDEKTGLPIYSLYGATQRPTDAMLGGIDTMVIDLQDVGTRFYTYATTMAYVMEEAAKRKLKVVVLDRPNPVNGWQVEGPPLDEGARGFTGYLPEMPIRHGMTLGELARLFNDYGRIGCDLEIVALQHWTRAAWFDDTALEWINPSPNMRNLIAATLYPGIGAFEFANLSVGRGTETPFEQIGAPWIDGRRLADAVNARAVPGVRVYAVRFTPAASKFAGEPCSGVFFVVTDREALKPVRLGVEVASALVKLFPAQIDFGKTSLLLGSADTLNRIRAGEDPAIIAASWANAESQWRRLRAKYLLY
jgi:uncharacterized protein YbbC (DUF1343 family)/CubicO group peptidase (beta-lactamase class C family)